MEVLHDALTASSFNPLSVHQSQTPSSFFTGTPILHHHSPSTTLKIHTSDLASAPALSKLAEGAHRPANGTPAAVNGHAEAEEHDEELVIRGVDVWVTSESVSHTLPYKDYSDETDTLSKTSNPPLPHPHNRPLHPLPHHHPPRNPNRHLHPPLTLPPTPHLSPNIRRP